MSSTCVTVQTCLFESVAVNHVAIGDLYITGVAHLTLPFCN